MVAHRSFHSFSVRTLLRAFFVLSFLVFLPAMATASSWSVERLVEEPTFGSQVYLREAGVENSKILLLVHGIGDRAGTIWDDLVPELAREYHVVAPDLPGFGRSSKGNHLYSPKSYSIFLDWLISRLPAKPVTLVGHSLGGSISLMYSSLYGDKLERLVLIDAVGLLHRLAVGQDFLRQQLQLDLAFPTTVVEKPMGVIASLFLEKVSRIPLSPGLILNSPTMRQKFLIADPTKIAGLALMESDYSLLLKKSTTPTWLIWGEEDKVASLRIAKILDWNLPQVKLIALPGLGHSPMLEDLPNFSTALQQTLQEKVSPRKQQYHQFNGIGTCNNEQGKVLTGNYSAVKITNCRGVVLRDIVTSSVVIVDSEVVIEAATLNSLSAQPALDLLRSKVVITGADIIAKTGAIINQSRIDLAGVRFYTSEAAIKAVGNPSSVLCSSSVKYGDDTAEGLHLNRSLKENEVL